METDFKKTPGLVVGAINGDSTIIQTYGETTKGNQTKPSEKTIFEIGSCTKLFTASIIAILKEEGKLKYEDDVSKYLDKLYFENKNITILDLLTHQSGFTRFPTYFGEEEENAHRPYDNYTYQLLEKYLKELQPKPREKRVYTYSHTNYIILTLIIEKITQQRLEYVLKEKLFKPLGMNDTKIKLTEIDKKRLATGYNILDNEAIYWNTEVFRGALGAKSTLHDLLIFTKAQLKSSDEILIQALQNMHDISKETTIKKVSSGLGWHHVQPKKRYYSFLAHSGATDGHQVYICFLKETKTAVVVMANSKHNLDGLGSYLLKMLNKKWKRKR